jgi:hypothetical protein
MASNLLPGCGFASTAQLRLQCYLSKVSDLISQAWMPNRWTRAEQMADAGPLAYSRQQQQQQQQQQQ